MDFPKVLSYAECLWFHIKIIRWKVTSLIAGNKYDKFHNNDNKF